MFQSVQNLIEELEDVDDATREDAAKALAKLGDPETLDDLLLLPFLLIPSIAG